MPHPIPSAPSLLCLMSAAAGQGFNRRAGRLTSLPLPHTGPMSITDIFTKYSSGAGPLEGTQCGSNGIKTTYQGPFFIDQRDTPPRKDPPPKSPKKSQAFLTEVRELADDFERRKAPGWLADCSSLSQLQERRCSHMKRSTPASDKQGCSSPADGASFAERNAPLQHLPLNPRHDKNQPRRTRRELRENGQGYIDFLLLYTRASL